LLLMIDQTGYDNCCLIINNTCRFFSDFSRIYYI
jgi:hypothetical protein